MKGVAVPLASLDDLGYDPAELEAFVADDAAWRERNPHVVGGPLRDSKGRMAPVPAYMRLDLQTDRNGPVPTWNPSLGPCWIWTGAPVRGYGYVRVGKRKVQAYRVNYERWVGPIPDGAVMDHLCRVRRCVNPLHVEPVTYKENSGRSPLTPAARYSARDFCANGHPFDEENTRWWRNPKSGNMTRQCRACGREWRRREYGHEPCKVATKAHCVNGHEWHHNIVWRANGRRACRRCQRDADARSYAKKKAERVI